MHAIKEVLLPRQVTLARRHPLPLCFGALPLPLTFVLSQQHHAALSQISDFGLSAKMGLDETHIEGAHHGTLSHMAPEVLREGRQSKASDV